MPARLGNVLLWAIVLIVAVWLIWIFFREPLTTIATIAAVALAALVLVQIRDTRQSSEKQLRAYVSVEPSGINHYGSPGEKEILGHVEIINNGMTPARGYTLWRDALLPHLAACHH